MMLQFSWPWALLLLPLPLLIYRFWPEGRHEPEVAPLRVPVLDDFEQSEDIGKSNQILSWLLLCLCWLFLILTMAHPVWEDDPIPVTLSGRDLLMAIDLSGSMEVEDFFLKGRQMNRLQATKIVAGSFIERRVGDRIGLILFGSQPYLQAPLTFDRATVTTFLNEAAIGLAGEKTAIGDAIGLAVKQLKDRPDQNRVVILLTDGANTTGAADPLEAANYAAQEKITLYTIGIGAEEMIVPSLFGQRRVNPSQDLDEKTLERIASITGGKYFRATNSQELEKIYQLIDQFEPVDADTQWFRPQKSLHYLPLCGAVLATLLLFWRKTRS